PPPRDTVELVRFASSRLGKTGVDLKDVVGAVPDRVLLDHLTWQLGPGDRIGLGGVNGAGKSTLLRVLDEGQRPDSGTVRSGRTVRLAHLSQNVTDLDPTARPLKVVMDVRDHVTLGKRDYPASQMLERFGFRGD